MVNRLFFPGRDKLPPGQTRETVPRQQHGARQVFCCRAHMFHDRVQNINIHTEYYRPESLMDWIVHFVQLS